MKSLRAYDYLHCRGLGHTWGPLVIQRTGTVLVTRTCDGCGMTGERKYSYSGVFIHSRYIAPDGYRIPGGADRSDVRSALFGRKRAT